MLNFILGRASSGKTYTVLNRIKEAVLSDKSPVLIVPEQFSFESEKAILNMLGDTLASKVSVLPFTRIYETVGRIKGGICGKTLSNADKLILMSRSIASVSDELCLWGRYAKSVSFAENMIKTIDEFKYNAVSSDDLRNQANLQKSKKLCDKLNDTALIFDTYEAFLGTNFTDPSDYMDKLYYMLEDCDFFGDKTVFFDGFKSFSGQQFKIIDRIIAKANDVTFALIDDIEDKRPLCLLQNIRKIEDKIRRMAKSHNVSENTPVYLSEKHYLSEDLKAFEECMFNGIYKSDIKMPNVTVCRAESIYDEAEWTARNIKRIMRENGARFDDFVVIARDAETYEDALNISCKRNKVKCFIDKKFPIISMPVSAAVLSAIAYAQNTTAKNILKFHKSGISLLSVDEICAIENYIYIWNLTAKDFEREWDMNPLGLTDREDENSAEKLKKLNKIREKSVLHLKEFKKNFKGTPKERAGAVVKLLENANAKSAFTSLYNDYIKDSKEDFAALILKSYSEFMSVLDSIIKCYPDTDISSADFFDALNSSLKFATVGVTPQTLDEVTFGSAERIRPARPKYAFVLGVNAGIFPKISKSSGLFTLTELSNLKDAGLDIPDKTVDEAFNEELLIYSNICCASEKVFISYSETLPDGSSAEAAAFLNEICKNMQVNTVFEPDKLLYENLPETEESAFLEYCKRKEESGFEAQTIKSALESLKTAGKIEAYAENITAQNARLSPDTAKKLYGKSIYMSPTKFDNYNRCKFMFFCKNALKASKLYPADFNVMQRGTLVHYVLQRIIEIYGKNISLLSEGEISENVDKLTNEYLDGIKGYREVETPRSKYLVSTMTRSLKYVVARLASEFSQSDFEPKACELVIGSDGDIPEIKVDLKNDNKLLLGGVIDRLDTYKGYVRIVDYKTGSRNFRLPDVLFGQNMQMLLYLYTVVKSGNFGDTPAGILYMKAQRVKDGTVSERRMNGLLLADSDSVIAMDKENKGEFVPKYNEAKPSDSYLIKEDYESVFEFIDKKLKSVGNDIFDGLIGAEPIDGIDSPACKYCDFKSVCRISEDLIKCVPKMANGEVINLMKGETENG